MKRLGGKSVGSPVEVHAQYVSKDVGGRLARVGECTAVRVKAKGEDVGKMVTRPDRRGRMGCIMSSGRRKDEGLSERSRPGQRQVGRPGGAAI